MYGIDRKLSYLDNSVDSIKRRLSDFEERLVKLEKRLDSQVEVKAFFRGVEDGESKEVE